MTRSHLQGETLVLMSGGIDSTACAHLLVKKGSKVRGVHFDYGQAAAGPERRAVQSLATHLALPLTILEVRGAEPFASGELPGRNSFLIFAALFLARPKSGLLAIGVHAGTPYYDCSSSFIEMMTKVVGEHTDGRLTLVAPFVEWSKADVFQYFLSSGLPVQIAYSCEAGNEPPCGSCMSCRDRRALGC